MARCSLLSPATPTTNFTGLPRPSLALSSFFMTQAVSGPRIMAPTSMVMSVPTDGAQCLVREEPLRDEEGRDEASGDDGPNIGHDYAREEGAKFLHTNPRSAPRGGHGCSCHVDS